MSSDIDQQPAAPLSPASSVSSATSSQSAAMSQQQPQQVIHYSSPAPAQTRHTMPRRNSLVPSIKRWAVSVNNDSDRMRRQFSDLQQQRRKSMDDGGTLDDSNDDDYRHNDAVDNRNCTRTISRRASLDVDVERAVAMVNEYPELDPDDRQSLTPFGNRRDSLL